MKNDAGKDHHEIGPTKKITAAVRLKPWFRGLWSWHTACTRWGDLGAGADV